jgi:uncharacterized membrane protein YgdD (TMEM256/DUF423 family)
MEPKDTGKSRESWLGYGAEFFTIFFALALLAGRVYAQSYWSIFGLSPDIVDTNLINYAIISPNTAVASVIMAGGAVALIGLLRSRPPDFVGDYPTAAYWIGGLAFAAGLFAISFIPYVNLSNWVAGTAGLAFGVGFLCFSGGFIIWMEAMRKLEKKPQPQLVHAANQWFRKHVAARFPKTPQWVHAANQWFRKHVAAKFIKRRSPTAPTKNRKLPIGAIQVFMVIAIAAVSLWGILDTAHKFGVDEAAMTYDARPIVTLLVDSPNGLEDLAPTLNLSGSTLVKVKIITEAGGFLYVSPGITTTPLQLHVRAVPVSRVQAIQYAVGITPLNK